MKIDILTLKRDLNREIEESRRKIQRAECILEYLENRFGEIQRETPQTEDPLPETKWELIKQTGEKLRRRFCIGDIKDHFCKKYPDKHFDPKSFKKALKFAVKRDQLILVQEGHRGAKKTDRYNFYKLSEKPFITT